jgi:YVTN family beta-propeller protein
MSSGDVLVVASQAASRVDFFDPYSFEKLGSIPEVVETPHEIAWDAGRRLAYVAHTYRAGGYNEGYEKAHEISVIDLDAQAVVEVIDIAPYLAPHDVEYDPNQDLIVTGVEATGENNGLVLIDAASRQVLGAIELGAANAHWLTVTPDGSKAYVSHKEAEEISVVDLVARRQIAAIPVPGGVEEIDCSPDGAFVYAGTPMMSLKIDVGKGSLTKDPKPGSPRPSVIKIDTRTDEVVDRLEFDEYLAALRVAPDGRVLASEFHFPTEEDPEARGILNVIDTADGMSLAATIVCDELPFTTRCSPDGARAYVANVKTGTVTVVDLEDNKVVGTIDQNAGAGFGGTHGMCYAGA